MRVLVLLAVPLSVMPFLVPPRALTLLLITPIVAIATAVVAGRMLR